MKRILAGLFALILLFPSAAHAVELANPGTPARKLQRGLLNLALCPIEISQGIVERQHEDTVVPGWIVGVLKGSVNAVSRGLVGAYEVVTTPFPLPSHYNPVLQPEFAWQHLKAEAPPSATEDLNTL